jgi:hypothetical protein
MIRSCAEKKGEVVEPAGGETGVPHCLAEDYKLPMAALYLLINFAVKN